MSDNCSHDQCEDYRACQRLTGAEREAEFRLLSHLGQPVGHLATDPLAWLNGDSMDG